MTRKYAGKYPNAVRTVSAKDQHCTVITNAGTVLRFEGIEGAKELDFRLPKVGDDMTGHLLVRGIATRSGVENRANDQTRSMSATAPRFARGDVCTVITARGDIRAVVVDITYPTACPVYVMQDDQGNEFTAPARAVFPLSSSIVSPRAMKAHGVRVSPAWTIQAREMLELLGVSKLPADAMHVRWIQGHAVYVISAKEAHDIGEFHRVRVICSDCGAHVPFGRIAQHVCK